MNAASRSLQSAVAVSPSTGRPTATSICPKRAPHALRAVCAAAAIASAAAGHAAEPAPTRDADSAPTIIATFAYHANVAAYGAGVEWPVHAFADALAPHRLQLLVAGDLARWEGRSVGRGFLWDTSVTPILRWRPWDGAFARAYVQAGIGIHILSETSINGGARNFGSAFQFGERAAIGMRFGAHDRFEASLFVQHISNAEIKEPNDGMTQFGAALGVALD